MESIFIYIAISLLDIFFFIHLTRCRRLLEFSATGRKPEFRLKPNALPNDFFNLEINVL